MFYLINYFIKVFIHFKKALTVNWDLDVGTDDTKSFVDDPCEDWLSQEKSE